MRGIDDQANWAKRHLEINKKLKKACDHVLSSG